MKSLIPRGMLCISDFKLVQNISRNCKFTASVFITLIVLSSSVFAQTFPPQSSCTSKDLELVSATLTGGNACNSCTMGISVTRTLTLGINNKTGSTRTSFQFWGTFVVKRNGTVVSSTPITGCAGPIPPTGPLPSAYTQNFGNITYQCGDAMEITDLYLAWTDASPKSTCPLNPSTINPKCGTLPGILVNAGVNGNFTTTGNTCSGGTSGAINLTPFGGTSPYTFSWSASAGGSIPSGQSTNQNLTSLTSGTYSCTITDHNNCSITKSTNVTGPSASLTLGTCSKTDVSCAGGDGIATAGSVSNAVGSVSYTWRNSSNSIVGTTAQVTGLGAGTYTLTITDNCTSQTCSVTITAPGPISKPTLCIVEPSLCGSSTGSITVLTPTGTGYQYSKDGGTTWQSSPIFSGLAAGSNPSIIVQNPDGCISPAANCSEGTLCTSSRTQPTAAANQELTMPVQQPATTVKAYPNPFNDRIKFLVTATEAGQGSLEVINTLGQKVKTVYQGYIFAGEQYFEMFIPTQQRSSLIYIFKMANKQITGKLVHTGN